MKPASARPLLATLVRLPLFALVALVTFVALALFGRDARAGAGTFTVTNQRGTAQEVGGGWHVYCRLELPRAPQTAHQSMRFIFTRTAAYELSLVDGHSDPVESVTTLTGQNPNVESLDVSFTDGSGKIFKGTSFDFFVTRNNNYLPGEYRVQLRTSDGVDIGGPQTLRLERIKNPDDPNYKKDIVDRRAMVFNAKEPAIKKVPTGIDGGLMAKNGVDESATPTNNGPDEVAPVGSASFIPQDAYNKTSEEEIKERPKGCGCSVPGMEPVGFAGGVAALGLIGLAVARRGRNRR